MQRIAESFLAQRLAALLTGVFGMVGLLLAGVGLYGVVSYSVAQRTREIGVRMALGAHARDVLRLVVRQGFVLIGMGATIGIVAGEYPTTAWVRHLLPGLYNRMWHGYFEPSTWRPPSS